MAIPTEKEIELPLLYEIEQAGGAVGQNAAKYKELHDKVAAHFLLMTSAERAEKRKSGHNKFDDKVRWSAGSLSYKGELVRSHTPPGMWTITEKGRERLGAKPPPPPPPPPPLHRHEQLKKAMVEIGSRLGHYTKTENGPVYRHDVSWHDNEYATTPSYVIEVCEGGSLPKDFDALHWASDKWRAKGILVVTDDKDFEKARKRFAGQPNVAVVKAETVEHLHKVAQDNPEFLRFVFGK